MKCRNICTQRRAEKVLAEKNPTGEIAEELEVGKYLTERKVGNRSKSHA